MNSALNFKPVTKESTEIDAQEPLKCFVVCFVVKETGVVGGSRHYKPKNDPIIESKIVLFTRIKVVK